MCSREEMPTERMHIYEKGGSQSVARDKAERLLYRQRLNEPKRNSTTFRGGNLDGDNSRPRSQ